jgi:histidinol phosphatase-like enzyme (inositol monophosphatase family)
MDARVLMEAALDLAGHAGAVALRHFGRAVEVETKTDGSPVTRADREAEQAAREWLARRFPGDLVLGEESGGARSGDGRRWIVDPVDGTRAFIRGVPLWGTLVACVEGPEVLAAAAAFPAARRAMAAARGGGAWVDGRAARVSGVAVLGEATVLATDFAFHGDGVRAARALGVTAAAAAARTWGDAYGYLLVASGAAEVMLDAPFQPWDAAPMLLLVEEAGGVFTDWHGDRDWSGAHGAIATNAALAAVVRERLVLDPDQE